MIEENTKQNQVWMIVRTIGISLIFSVLIFSGYFYADLSVSKLLSGYTLAAARLVLAGFVLSFLYLTTIYRKPLIASGDATQAPRIQVTTNPWYRLRLLLGTLLILTDLFFTLGTTINKDKASICLASGVMMIFSGLCEKFRADAEWRLLPDELQIWSRNNLYSRTQWKDVTEIKTNDVRGKDYKWLCTISVRFNRINRNKSLIQQLFGGPFEEYLEVKPNEYDEVLKALKANTPASVAWSEVT